MWLLPFIYTGASCSDKSLTDGTVKAQYATHCFTPRGIWKAVQTNVEQNNLIQGVYEFERDHKLVEATSIIYRKGEGSVSQYSNQMVEKILLGLQEPRRWSDKVR